MQCAQAAEVRRSYGIKSSQDAPVLAITDPICDPTATLVVESYHSQSYITMAAMFNVVKPQPIFKALRDPLDGGKINLKSGQSRLQLGSVYCSAIITFSCHACSRIARPTGA